ncbi:MAG TPA: cation diffusion facilitator family transporter [Thermodesulfovibrionales bacterium]|jgi:cation diffusion facilitator family transporter|nr:cation diffusion facilitator family transporter [Thermodesulfovibrionales bacterium]
MGTVSRTDRAADIKSVLLITLCLNILVSSAKVTYGYWTHSIAIISDGFHSLFDGISNIAGLIGIRIAASPPDEEHPYGHRKYETVFTIFVGLMMILTCTEILKGAYRSLSGSSEVRVTTASFIVMIATMCVNIFVSWYEGRKGKQLSSEFLIADARHTRNDIYSTCGVIASLILTELGFPLADPLAGIIVGLLVAKAGISVIRESIETLVDRKATDTITIRNVVCTVDGVRDCHKIRARGNQNHIFIDLHVLVDPSLSVEKGHVIASSVEYALKNNISNVVDVVVHVEPFPKVSQDK